MLGTQTWFKTVRCHSIWAWFGAKPRTFLKGSAQLPAQLFVPAHFRKVACGVLVRALSISLGLGILFYIYIFSYYYLSFGSWWGIIITANLRKIACDREQSGDSARLKVSLISRNVTAAARCKHFLPNKETSQKWANLTCLGIQLTLKLESRSI